MSSPSWAAEEDAGARLPQTEEEIALGGQDDLASALTLETTDLPPQAGDPCLMQMKLRLINKDKRAWRPPLQEIGEEKDALLPAAESRKGKEIPLLSHNLDRSLLPHEALRVSKERGCSMIEGPDCVRPPLISRHGVVGEVQRSRRRGFKPS